MPKSKRLFDLVICLLLLPLFVTVSVVVAVLILLFLGRPVLFSQPRPGQFGHVFHIYKFRSMGMHKDEKGELLSDAERLGRFGRWLRASSLDELPVLWNVLKGDMSLVGPRPLLEEYLPLYTPEQNRRHDVKPGVTGWAQVNGRNSISWEDKFKHDVWYVDNRSFLLDLKILCMTVKLVLTADGVSHEGHVTMEKFRGSSNL